ncbi:MAG: C-GCAxxG-C-C family protein [Clostridia bacterium]|nr:C-GCAxxG-C-C family protein [Clostridia bacterium]
MQAKKAKKHYLGQDGCKRMNCAQSIICAFKENFNFSEDIVESFKSFGGGNAPDGLCGAFYAVKYIMEQKRSEQLNLFENYFLEHAGALSCRDIKGLRKLSCIGCVEKSAEFLESLG